MAVVFAAYIALGRLATGRRLQNRMLLVASYVFYGWWDWRFLSLIAFSTALDFVIAHRIARSNSEILRKRLLWLSLSVNLGMLGVFKYLGFFLDSARELALAIGLHPPTYVLEIVLPVGISFYTFQTLSYTIDVYRRELAPTDDFLDFALFVSFFPQLVAGPIERASHFLPQLLQPRTITRERIESGTWLVVWGLYKKIVIADNLGQLVDAQFAATPRDGSGAAALLGVYAFAFQIYADFSGYTDIARGVARWMGFELSLNFRRPYFATSPQELWRRWHISLSTWLRDYLYIPLGGNRGSEWFTRRNLLLTMALGGLWHGAAWTFVAWGVFHGLALGLHRALPKRVPHEGRARFWALVVHVGSVVAMFHFVCLGWLLFRAETLADAWMMIERIASWDGVSQAVTEASEMLLILCAPLLILDFAQELDDDELVVFRFPTLVRSFVYFVVLSYLFAFGTPAGRAFVYFQF
jgi:D-alanyl-lipoteichoic acid acyltransferase DltB (MBOAT superfamily)